MEMEFCPAGLPVAPIPERLVSQRVSLLQHLNKQHETASNTIRNKDMFVLNISESDTIFHAQPPQYVANACGLYCIDSCFWILLMMRMVLVPYQPDRTHFSHELSSPKGSSS